MSGPLLLRESAISCGYFKHDHYPLAKLVEYRMCVYVFTIIHHRRLRPILSAHEQCCSQSVRKLVIKQLYVVGGLLSTLTEGVEKYIHS